MVGTRAVCMQVSVLIANKYLPISHLWRYMCIFVCFKVSILTNGMALCSPFSNFVLHMCKVGCCFNIGPYEWLLGCYMHVGKLLQLFFSSYLTWQRVTTCVQHVIMFHNVCTCVYQWVILMQLVASMDVNATHYRADTRVQKRRKVHTCMTLCIL